VRARLFPSIHTTHSQSTEQEVNQWPEESATNLLRQQIRPNGKNLHFLHFSKLRFCNYEKKTETAAYCCTVALEYRESKYSRMLSFIFNVYILCETNILYNIIYIRMKFICVSRYCFLCKMWGCTLLIIGWVDLFLFYILNKSHLDMCQVPYKREENTFFKCD
jgi:hypothetical protein